MVAIRYRLLGTVGALVVSGCYLPPSPTLPAESQVFDAALSVAEINDRRDELEGRAVLVDACLSYLAGLSAFRIDDCDDGAVIGTAVQGPPSDGGRYPLAFDEKELPNSAKRYRSQHVVLSATLSGENSLLSNRSVGAQTEAGAHVVIFEQNPNLALVSVRILHVYN